MATNTSITTTARNKQDVDNMSAADRLWDSLNYSYGQKRIESDKAFDQAISQQDRQLLSRGMQRSSYGMQTLGNMRQQKVDAQNAIYDQQIADYENRKSDLEQQEWQRDFQERNFNEGIRQFDLNFGFQKDRAAVGDEQWAKQFAEDVRMNNMNSATNYAMTMLQNGQMPSDEMLAAAGLSKADAQRLLSGFNAAKAGSSSSSSGDPGPSNNNPPPPANEGDTFTDQALMDRLALGQLHNRSEDSALFGILGGTSTSSSKPATIVKPNQKNRIDLLK